VVAVVVELALLQTSLVNQVVRVAAWDFGILPIVQLLVVVRDIRAQQDQHSRDSLAVVVALLLHHKHVGAVVAVLVELVAQ
jgi:hypothetical protein